MPQIPDDEISHIFAVAKALSNSSLRALEVQGSNIIVANGVAAGQRAQHFMAHLIPRKENDGVNFQVPQKTISEEELQATRKILSESLGAKAEETKVVPTLPKMPREKKVVEAKFKEKKQHKKKKPIKNKETKKEKKSGSGESINLDDIAKVLGPG